MQWAFAANSAACRRGSGAGGPKPMHLATFHALCRHSKPRVTCNSVGLTCCMLELCWDHNRQALCVAQCGRALLMLCLNSGALNARRILSGSTILASCRMPRPLVAELRCALASALRSRLCALPLCANRWRACLRHHGLRCQCGSRPLGPRRQRCGRQLRDNCTSRPAVRYGALTSAGGLVRSGWQGDETAKSSTALLC